MYTGPTPLSYHSAPSGFDYLFDPFVDQEVKKEDEKFFKSMTQAEGSDFKIGGWKTKIEPKIKERLKSEPKTKNGGK